jgi:hypothetical protein
MDPVGNSGPILVLRLAGHSELPQPPWRRRRRAIGVGKVKIWRENSKIDNDNWMIDLNWSRPVIFSVGGLALPGTLYLDSGLPDLTAPEGWLDRLAGSMLDRLQDTSVRPPLV